MMEGGCSYRNGSRGSSLATREQPNCDGGCGCRNGTRGSVLRLRLGDKVPETQ